MFFASDILKHMNVFALTVVYFCIMELIVSIRLMGKKKLLGFVLLIFAIIGSGLVFYSQVTLGGGEASINNMTSIALLLSVILAIASALQLKQYGGIDKKFSILLLCAPLVYIIGLLVTLPFVRT